MLFFPLFDYSNGGNCANTQSKQAERALCLLGCNVLRSHHCLRDMPAFGIFPSIQSLVFLTGQSMVEHLHARLC